MAYEIKIVSTKPAGTKWYSQSGIIGSTQVLANIRSWNESQTGYMSGSGTYKSTDVYEYITVFDTQVNGDAWLEAGTTQPDRVIRKAYLDSIGVNQQVTKTVI